MLKRSITYEDFNGKTQTEDFFFNLSKSELVELEFDVDGGFADSMQKLVDENNSREIIATFKKLVLQAYGEKSDDGKRFVKSDQLREEFSQTAAYSVLFMELSTDAEVASNFIKGIMPADMQAAIAEEELKQKTAAALSTQDPTKTTAQLAAEQAAIDTTEVQ